MTDQRQNAKIFMEAVRDVLMQDWDPIGVMTDPSAPRDEYDTYIGPIISALARGDSARTIASQLCQIEQDQMGLNPPSVASRLSVANKLKAIEV